MTPPPLALQILSLSDPSAQRRLLDQHAPQLTNAEADLLADALKDAADQHLRGDAHRARALAHLLYHLSDLTQNPFQRVLGLFAEANACAIGGLGEYARAIALCDQAAALCAAANRPVDQADAQVTKIYALSMLGRYDEALAAGQWAAHILTQHQAWLQLATVMMNLAIVYGRMGKDAEALAHFEQAGMLYAQAGEAGDWSRPGVEMNRALVLRNLGRFEESLTANEQAIQLLTELGQHAEVGHAQQTMAFTYYVLGRYNEAQELLHRARTLFATYQRPTDVLLADLYLSHCLLTMRRFAHAITICNRVAREAARLGQRVEEGHALLNKATALAELSQWETALDLLTAARAVFASAGNPVWAAQVELEVARVHLRCRQPALALAAAQRCATTFATHQVPVPQAHARLLAGHAYMALNQLDAAREIVESVLATARQMQLPDLHHRAYHLLGRLAEQMDDDAGAATHYAHAIDQLERLRGRLMVEFRAAFMEDKMIVYEDAVRLCIRQNEVEQALQMAERARSRGLRDLLAHRLDLRIQARHAADQPLVAELTTLQQERDLLFRRALYEQGFALYTANPSQLDTPQLEAAQPDTVQLDTAQLDADKVAALEARTTELWHTLLIHNADYAREAAQWQAPIEPPQPVEARLEDDTLLLEYYAAHGTWQLFLVTRHSTQVISLSASMAQVQRLIDLFWRNLKMVPHSTPQQVVALTVHVQKILHQLYAQLLAPAQSALKQARRLIIVPHGPLHYVPFQALRPDARADAYLLDSHEISYLPSASFLQTVPQVPSSPLGATTIDAAIFGHSYGGALPHTVAEATSVAQITGGRDYVEDAVTKAQVQAAAAHVRLLHLATHGEFRADNPLFSGLALADGRFTTLDIFNLRTSASLVTLSACQTGRSVLGGGDELLGLMRAFLAAGAASLLLSMWPVHDASTAQLMTHFYRDLLAGKHKGAALRAAQQALRQQGEAGAYAHPYYWAPFFLVGDHGVL